MSDHRRQVATLAVRVLPSPHTADCNEELVREVLQNWDIPLQKISAVLTDNGSNMVAAFKEWVQTRESEVEEVEEEEGLLMFLLRGVWMRMIMNKNQLWI